MQRWELSAFDWKARNIAYICERTTAVDLAGRFDP